MATLVHCFLWYWYLYLNVSLTVSQTGGALGRYHPAGEERHSPAAWCDQGEHTLQWTCLFRLPQHQWDLQAGGAAGQHRHASAPGQQRLRTGPLAAQTEEEVTQEGVGTQEVRAEQEDLYSSIINAVHTCLRHAVDSTLMCYGRLVGYPDNSEQRAESLKWWRKFGLYSVTAKAQHPCWLWNITRVQWF